MSHFDSVEEIVCQLKNAGFPTQIVMWKYQELLNQNLQIILAIAVGVLTVFLRALDQNVRRAERAEGARSVHVAARSSFPAGRASDRRLAR